MAEIPWQSGNPLVLRARLASLTQTRVVFLFVEDNYCPPVEVLGLEKDRVFGAGTLGQLGDISSASCCSVAGRPAKARSVGCETIA